MLILNRPNRTLLSSCFYIVLIVGAFWCSSTLRAQPASAPAPDTSFLGMTLGMSSAKALPTLNKPNSALNSLRWIAGRRIVNDTIALTDCKLSMRRSVGFDSANQIGAIGLTYRTTPKKIADARQCAYDWLTKLYGSPSLVDTTGKTRIESWSLGNARLTLEAKGYTENDYFVLIYYYALKP